MRTQRVDVPERPDFYFKHMGDIWRNFVKKRNLSLSVMGEKKGFIGVIASI